jgi:hypothetical protein
VVRYYLFPSDKRTTCSSTIFPTKRQFSIPYSSEPEDPKLFRDRARYPRKSERHRNACQGKLSILPFLKFPPSLRINASSPNFATQPTPDTVPSSPLTGYGSHFPPPPPCQSHKSHPPSGSCSTYVPPRSSSSPEPQHLMRLGLPSRIRSRGPRWLRRGGGSWGPGGGPARWRYAAFGPRRGGQRPKQR